MRCIMGFCFVLVASSLAWANESNLGRSAIRPSAACGAHFGSQHASTCGSRRNKSSRQRCSPEQCWRRPRRHMGTPSQHNLARRRQILPETRRITTTIPRGTTA